MNRSESVGSEAPQKLQGTQDISRSRAFAFVPYTPTNATAKKQTLTILRPALLCCGAETTQRTNQGGALVLALAFTLPAEVRLHLDFLLALRYVVQLPDEHAVAVRENADLKPAEDGAVQVGKIHRDIAVRGRGATACFCGSTKF